MANNNPDTSKLGTKGKTFTKIHDPRVIMFKQYYCDATAPTFCNILQSALKAGYSQTYAQNISVQKPAWWVELVDSSDMLRARMLQKAEKNIDKVLDDTEDSKDAKDRKFKASSFVSERLGKDHYSTRKELTDKGGKRLFSNQTDASTDVELDDLFVGIASDTPNIDE
jgi:hypothetical protein